MAPTMMPVRALDAEGLWIGWVGRVDGIIGVEKQGLSRDKLELLLRVFFGCRLLSYFMS